MHHPMKVLSFLTKLMPSILGANLHLPCAPPPPPSVTSGLSHRKIRPMFRLAAVLGATVVGTLLSWMHFGGIWKGVVVSGAGDIGAVSRLLPHRVLDRTYIDNHRSFTVSSLDYSIVLPTACLLFSLRKRNAHFLLSHDRCSEGTCL